MDAWLNSTGTVQIRADSDRDGTGALAVRPGQLLGSQGEMVVHCGAIDLQGAVHAAQSQLSMFPSPSYNARIGDWTGDLSQVALDSPELRHINASSLLVSASSAAAVLSVGSVGPRDSYGVAERVELQAASGHITFSSSSGAHFRRLSTKAGAGVTIRSNINATEGDLLIDGGAVLGGASTRRAGDLSPRIIVAAGTVLWSQGALTLQAPGGIWPEGPMTVYALCGIYVNTPIRGPFIEYVEYITSDGCDVNVAEDPFNWWILAVPCVALLCCIPLAWWKCRARDPVVPETGEAGKVLSVCEFKTGKEGELWKVDEQPYTTSPVEAFEAPVGEEGALGEDPLPVGSLEELAGWRGEFGDVRREPNDLAGVI